jgi:quercetin dioxygenase-like cupin family protein
MDIQNFFMGKDAPEKSVADGVVRQVLAHATDLMVCRLQFTKGAIGALHSHPHVQITYIISGVFEFEIGERKVVLRSGDSTFKQPGIVHGAVCLEAGELLDIFHPQREDFLEK